MKKRTMAALLLTCIASMGIMGCGSNRTDYDNTGSQGQSESDLEVNAETVNVGDKMMELEDGLSAISFEGNDGFAQFLEKGGATSDAEVVAYLKDNLLSNIPDLIFGGNPFGCSTLLVPNAEGGFLFGRNFDWNSCDALIIRSTPEDGYASISTVNTDFIQAGGVDISSLPDQIQAIIGLYAPLDGMNEMGLAVSVNMIQDGETIEQDTDNPDITTTTAIRMLLNQASDVEEALELLRQHDLHASMGMMIHFAMADAEGRSVVVEYVGNEMIVTKTPVVTNFYLAEGEKYGIGTAQSRTRFDILTEAIKNKESMHTGDVRDALSSVSKKNFDEFESTEWSIVMDLGAREATYYHRENYDKAYAFRME